MNKTLIQFVQLDISLKVMRRKKGLVWNSKKIYIFLFNTKTELQKIINKGKIIWKVLDILILKLYFFNLESLIRHQIHSYKSLYLRTNTEKLVMQNKNNCLSFFSFKPFINSEFEFKDLTSFEVNSKSMSAKAGQSIKKRTWILIWFNFPMRLTMSK